MCGIAICRLKISSDDFYNLTPIEFDYALGDYIKEVELNNRFELEVMRLQTLYLVNMQLDQNNQIKDVKDLMRFKWEEEDKNKELIIPDWEKLEKGL
jgi:hypothetical protein